MKLSKKFFVLTLFIALWLVASVCFAGFAHRQMAEGGYENVLVNDPTGVNVRSGPGTDYPILETVPYGSLLYVDVVWKSDAKWYKAFDADRKVGWVRSTLVEFPQLFATQGRKNIPLSGTVTADNSNVRAGTSAQCQYLGTLQKGEHVFVYAEALGWYYVYANEKNFSGWISRNYVAI